MRDPKSFIHHADMISSRHYIFALDGSLRRMSSRIAFGVYQGNDALPEFAGSRQKIATAVVRLEDRKPAQILDVQGRFWTFTADGKIDQDEQSDVLRELMNSAFSSPTRNVGKVVSLTPTIRKRQHDARHRWEPTKEELDRIAADLWPGIDGPVEEVEAVKGTAPVKPPLTSQGEHALQEIMSKISSIAYDLDNLTERALKGLAFEARRHATFEDDQGLWAGVAEAADRRREIKARHRTGKGAWYAIVEGWVDDPTDRHLTTQIDVASVRCEGKKAAVEAARRLLREHADKFSETVRIEACVRCDLEWKPLDDE